MIFPRLDYATHLRSSRSAVILSWPGYRMNSAMLLLGSTLVLCIAAASGWQYNGYVSFPANSLRYRWYNCLAWLLKTPACNSIVNICHYWLIRSYQKEHCNCSALLLSGEAILALLQATYSNIYGGVCGIGTNKLQAVSMNAAQFGGGSACGQCVQVNPIDP